MTNVIDSEPLNLLIDSAKTDKGMSIASLM
jgi:hypothetical protein